MTWLRFGRGVITIGGLIGFAPLRADGAEEEVRTLGALPVLVELMKCDDDMTILQVLNALRLLAIKDSTAKELVGLKIVGSLLGVLSSNIDEKGKRDAVKTLRSLSFTREFPPLGAVLSVLFLMSCQCIPQPPGSKPFAQRGRLDPSSSCWPAWTER